MNKKNKYLIVGMGPGETSQARAMAKYIAQKGGIVFFAVRKKANLHFVKNDKEFKVFLTGKVQDLVNLVEREKPDVFLLFNSKMWANKGFTEKPPFKKPKICISVDSNWLFNNKKYFPHFQSNVWMDKYLINLPEKIFKMGLKENKGNFIIPKSILKKTIPIGFIPIYKKISPKKILEIRKKYNIKKEEKFIFSYFSGFEAGHRVFAFNNLIRSIDSLTKKGLKIKVLYVGPTKNLDPKMLDRNWLIKEEKLSTDEFYEILSSSDLIFQHQGMVTLSQAISANIPVICNVHILKMYSHGVPKLHFWEVEPFDKVGVCKMFSKSSPIKKISQEIKNLLYNKKSIQKMKKNQELILEKGESKAYQIIKKLLKEKIRQDKNI